MSRRRADRSTPFSSRNRDVQSSATGRKVGRRRAPRRDWQGSSRWSPYGNQDRLWPKILIVGIVLAVVLGGSVVVAGVLGNKDDPGAAQIVPPADATASATLTATTEADDAGPTPTGEGVVVAPSPVGDQTATPALSPTPTPPDPASLTAPKKVAETYADVWSSAAYDQMYDLLSTESQAQISKEDFVARYQGIAVEAGIIELDAQVVSGQDDDLIFPLKVDINSSRIGDFSEDNQLPIVRDGDAFKVDWTPSLIFSGLGDGFVRWTSDVPQRGRILDRKGRPLAETGFISRVGVIPGQMTNESDLLSRLSGLIDMPQDEIKAKYADGQPNWFMPVKDFPDNMDPGLVDQLGQIDGVVVQKWPARTYPLGEAAAHITGYMSEITAEELPELAKQGYEAGDMIGRGGVEASAEKWLAGKRGGTLALVNTDGSVIRVLGEVQAEPANDVVLTVDLDLQRSAFEALNDKTGSSVVLDPNNGQVLAMASKPSFDPNKFILGLSDEEWQKINDPEAHPLVNRATAETYPTGSVFKLVTASAAIKHLGYTAGTPVSCPGTFSVEGSDQVWKDWVPGGQGDMDLHTAIYRSCNTVFYRIGELLDEQNEMWLPDMARAFGFGKRTGIQGLYDVAGLVPDPQWKKDTVGDYWARGDAVNLAIGQGYFAATPLQLAKAYVAVTNGGTLWKPYIIMDVVDVNGDVVHSGEPTEDGKLPVNKDEIKILTDGMYDVIHASNGTAVDAFASASYVISGKTGTAETGVEGEAAHGWFGSFGPSDKPRITVITMVEHGVAGSQSAAPVARRIYDDYFTLYPDG